MLVDSLIDVGVSTDWALSADRHRHDVLQNRRDRQRGDELGREIGVTHRPEGDALGEQRDRDPGQQGARYGRPEGQPGENEEGVGGEHDELAVGEVHHPHHRVDERDAEGDQGVEAAEREGIDQVLAQLGHREHLIFP